MYTRMCTCVCMYVCKHIHIHIHIYIYIYIYAYTCIVWYHVISLILAQPYRAQRVGPDRPQEAPGAWSEVWNATAAYHCNTTLTTIINTSSMFSSSTVSMIVPCKHISDHLCTQIIIFQGTSRAAGPAATWAPIISGIRSMRRVLSRKANLAVWCNICREAKISPNCKLPFVNWQPTFQLPVVKQGTDVSRSIIVISLNY